MKFCVKCDKGSIILQRGRSLESRIPPHCREMKSNTHFSAFQGFESILVHLLSGNLTRSRLESSSGGLIWLENSRHLEPRICLEGDQLVGNTYRSFRTKISDKFSGTAA